MQFVISDVMMINVRMYFIDYNIKDYQATSCKVCFPRKTYARDQQTAFYRNELN